jgi:glycosyltransferase involved in cell wall biosynthesis
MQSNHKAPKVSVVIPNYNHAKYLEARIDSVINQSFQDFEIILLDDASSDDSAHIIKKYLDHPQIRFFQNYKNSGSPFSQWRKGVSLASGTYVWIAESDDIADFRLLETLVKLLDSNPKVVLAYCQSSYINESGEVTGSALIWTDDLDAERWKYDFMNNGKDECVEYLSIKNTIPNASAVLFRKSAFSGINTETSMKLCGDWLIWSRIIRRGDLAFHAGVLNYFREHNSTARVTTSRKLRYKEIFQVARELLSVNLPSSEQKKILGIRLYTYWERQLDCRFPVISLGYILLLSKISFVQSVRLFKSLLIAGMRQVALAVFRKLKNIAVRVIKK